MPALASGGWLIEHALAVGTAILLALGYRAFATRMIALVGVLFGHDSLLLVFSIRPGTNGLLKQKTRWKVSPAGLWLRWRHCRV